MVGLVEFSEGSNLQCLEGKAVNATARDLKIRPSWEKEALIIGGSSAQCYKWHLSREFSASEF
jgi:hypothetical protein